MIAVYILILGTTLVFETSRRNKDRINEKLTRKIVRINKNLQDMVEERTQKIVKLQNSILKTMSNLVEYRDFVTGGHIERTQYGVNLLLDEIKKQKLFAPIINDWDMNLILQSVQLHDVGKIAISDLILNKPAQLTQEEYDEMKKHTVFGFKIIERIEADSGESELLNHAKIFALTHHEKWDGTGYPHGLHGDNIPLQGRIMAVADVYDALISDRPYKKALAHEEAVKIMINGKGTQFDPVLIDLFVRVSGKLMT
jgi:putative two-component system response regulator